MKKTALQRVITITLAALFGAAMIFPGGASAPDFSARRPAWDAAGINPVTGDQIAMWSVIGVIIAAAAVLIALLIIKKRGNKRG